MPGGGDRTEDDVLGVDDEIEVEEARVAKTARDPLAPTQAEWTAHQATHLPYRSWCPECVAGRRDNPAHKKRADEERMLPEVGIDYAFVRREEETERVTILVVKDRETRAIQASVMRHKGTCHDEAGERAAEFIKNLGHHGKLLIKADNEPALKDLRAATILHLDQGILPVKPPQLGNHSRME